MNATLLNEARFIRQQLRQSRLPHNFNATIRDAVEMAADNLRQIDHERWENSGGLDASYEAQFEAAL
jgi:hypothetical protein